MDKKILPWLAAGSMLLASCKDSQVPQHSSPAEELTTGKRIELEQAIKDNANLYSIVDQKVIEGKVQEMINNWHIPTAVEIAQLFLQESLEDARLQASE